jgi:hypothetical protein
MNNWDKSGNGTGQRPVDNDDDYDPDGEQEFQDGADRQSFLGPFKSHILYYWHIAEKFDILTTVKCVLDDSVAASSVSIPTAEVTRKRKGKNTDEETKFRQNIGESLGTLGYSAIIKQFREAVLYPNTAAKVSLINAQSDEEKKVWRKVLVAAGETVKELVAEKNKLMKQRAKQA